MVEDLELVIYGGIGRVACWTKVGKDTYSAQVNPNVSYATCIFKGFAARLTVELLHFQKARYPYSM